MSQDNNDENDVKQAYKQAYDSVKYGNVSISQAAKKYGVNKGILSTVLRFQFPQGDLPTSSPQEQSPQAEPTEPTFIQGSIKFVLNGLGFVAILVVIFILYSMFF